MTGELRFDGRVAMVTGGGSGIGREQALALARRGAKVLVNSRSRTGGAASESVCAEIRAEGGEAMPAIGTVGVDADARCIVQTAIDAYGRLDIVVNNAGSAGTITPIELSPADDFQREIDVHLFGALQINRAAWPHMVKQGYGRILFTGSACALGRYQGAEGGFEADYAIAKSTLFAALGQTAGAGEAHGIKANMVMPWAYTPQVERVLGESDFSDWMRKNLRAEQIAAGSLFLLHENCPANGEMISVAGGRVTRILFASPKGYFSPELTPEGVRDNWDAIYGAVGPDLTLAGMQEIRGQPGEFAIIKKLLPA
jgi:NAD(P)-dependent dehydrogenase (short-subunit alcohol dehydrogenase family)